MQTGVDLGKPPAVVDAVGDVGKALGPDGVHVPEQIVLQNLAVEAGHAVDHVAGGETEICHVDLPVADDEVAAQLVAGAELDGQIIAPAAVDLTHDLPQAGEQLLDQILGPLLQRLAHDGVVGVGHAVFDDVPGLIPAQAVLVHEDAHQLGDDHGRVGVVDLDDVVAGEGANIAPLAHMLAHDVLGGGGDEEILLLEAQELTLDVVVGGVEDLGDDLGHGALLHALDILALGEEVHVQRVGALGVPEAQGVDVLAAVAGDQHVAGQGDDGVVAGMLGAVVAVVVPVGRDLAAEADLHLVLVAGDEPGLRRGAPVVGDLYLLAVLEALLENAKLVADGIARGLQALGGHGVHITCGETAETAVAETGVRLFFKNVRGAAAHILQRADHRVGHAQVIGVLHEAAPHEKLHGHVVYFFFTLAGILNGQQTAHQLTDDDGGRLENLLVGGLLTGDGELCAELVFDRTADFFAGNLIDHE